MEKMLEMVGANIPTLSFIEKPQNSLLPCFTPLQIIAANKDVYEILGC